MRLLKITLFLVLTVILPGSLAHAQAHDGRLDLRGQNLDKALDLSGVWDFYWQSFVPPDQIEAFQDQRKAIQVPLAWTAAPEKYPTFGYATYHLTVMLDRPQMVGLYFPPSIWSASRIWVDGQEIARFGKLSKSQEGSVGGTGSKLHIFTPRAASFDIVIHVANFEIFLAGMNMSPRIGSVDAMLTARFEKLTVDVFVIGALFIMGIYHLCLFSLRRSDPSTLFFGLMCLCVMAYLSVTREGILTTLRPDLGFTTRLRLYNMTWMIALPMFAWFAYFSFREKFSIRVAYGITAISLVFECLALFTHPRFFVEKILFYQPFVGLMSIYAITVITRAWLQKVEGSGIFLIGMLILFAGVVLDVLSVQGFIALPPMGGFTVFTMIFFQSYMIARKFSFAFKRVRISEKAIRKLSDELKQEHAKVLNLNTNLERLVDEKTRDIRSIMEHIPLGIFMIKSDFHIHKDHSRHLQEIFAVPQDFLEQALATDLIFQHSSLTSDARSQALSALQSSLGENVVNFEVNAHTLPAEIIQHVDNRERVFDITWNVIANTESEVDKILVTMRDVTELRKLQERSRDQQEELAFIGEILNISSERFLRFTESCQTFIEENSRLIHSQGIQAQNLEVLKVLFINMHTIKGAARSLYFKKMTQVFHDVEQYYAVLQKDRHAVWDIRRMEADLKEAARIVGIYEKVAKEKLGRTNTHLRQIEFPRDLIEGLYTDMTETTRDKALPADVTEMLGRVRASLHVKLFKTIEHVFDDILECLPVLAKDLHKERPRVHLENRGILLSEKAEELFRRIFVHLLRNSMDHGLETPEERQEKGKDPEGHIVIHLEKQGNRMELLYRDDGRGLAVARIREIARVRHLLRPETSEDPAAIAELIFDSGLSTANHVSDISGRGVGMDAVRTFIQEVGGSITIQLEAETQPGFYAFCFRIDLPFSLSEESQDAPDQRAA